MTKGCRVLVKTGSVFYAASCKWGRSFEFEFGCILKFEFWQRRSFSYDRASVLLSAAKQAREKQEARLLECQRSLAKIEIMSPPARRASWQEGTIRKQLSRGNSCQDHPCVSSSGKKLSCSNRVSRRRSTSNVKDPNRRKLQPQPPAMMRTFDGRISDSNHSKSREVSASRDIPRCENCRHRTLDFEEQKHRLQNQESANPDQGLLTEVIGNGTSHFGSLNSRRQEPPQRFPKIISKGSGLQAISSIQYQAASGEQEISAASCSNAEAENMQYNSGDYQTFPVNAEGLLEGYYIQSYPEGDLREHLNGYSEGYPSGQIEGYRGEQFEQVDHRTQESGHLGIASPRDLPKGFFPKGSEGKCCSCDEDFDKSTQNCMEQPNLQPAEMMLHHYPFQSSYPQSTHYHPGESRQQLMEACKETQHAFHPPKYLENIEGFENQETQPFHNRSHDRHSGGQFSRQMRDASHETNHEHHSQEKRSPRRDHDYSDDGSRHHPNSRLKRLIGQNSRNPSRLDSSVPSHPSQPSQPSVLGTDEHMRSSSLGKKKGGLLGSNNQMNFMSFNGKYKNMFLDASQQQQARGPYTPNDFELASSSMDIRSEMLTNSHARWASTDKKNWMLKNLAEAQNASEIAGKQKLISREGGYEEYYDEEALVMGYGSMQQPPQTLNLNFHRESRLGKKDSSTRELTMRKIQSSSQDAQNRKRLRRSALLSKSISHKINKNSSSIISSIRESLEKEKESLGRRGTSQGTIQSGTGFQNPEPSQVSLPKEQGREERRRRKKRGSQEKSQGRRSTQSNKSGTKYSLQSVTKQSAVSQSPPKLQNIPHAQTHHDPTLLALQSWCHDKKISSSLANCDELYLRLIQTTDPAHWQKINKYNRSSTHRGRREDLNSRSQSLKRFSQRSSVDSRGRGSTGSFEQNLMKAHARNKENQEALEAAWLEHQMRFGSRQHQQPSPPPAEGFYPAQNENSEELRDPASHIVPYSRQQRKDSQERSNDRSRPPPESSSRPTPPLHPKQAVSTARVEQNPHNQAQLLHSFEFARSEQSINSLQMSMRYLLRNNLAARSNKVESQDEKSYHQMSSTRPPIHPYDNQIQAMASQLEQCMTQDQLSLLARRLTDQMDQRGSSADRLKKSGRLDKNYHPLYHFDRIMQSLQSIQQQRASRDDFQSLASTGMLDGKQPWLAGCDSQTFASFAKDEAQRNLYENEQSHDLFHPQAPPQEYLNQMSNGNLPSAGRSGGFYPPGTHALRQGHSIPDSSSQNLSTIQYIKCANPTSMPQSSGFPCSRIASPESPAEEQVQMYEDQQQFMPQGRGQYTIPEHSFEHYQNEETEAPGQFGEEHFEEFANPHDLPQELLPEGNSEIINEHYDYSQVFHDENQADMSLGAGDWHSKPVAPFDHVGDSTEVIQEQPAGGNDSTRREDDFGECLPAAAFHHDEALQESPGSAEKPSEEEHEQIVETLKVDFEHFDKTEQPPSTNVLINDDYLPVSDFHFDQARQAQTQATAPLPPRGDSSKKLALKTLHQQRDSRNHERMLHILEGQPLQTEDSPVFNNPLNLSSKYAMRYLKREEKRETYESKMKWLKESTSKGMNNLGSSLRVASSLQDSHMQSTEYARTGSAMADYHQHRELVTKESQNHQTQKIDIQKSMGNEATPTCTDRFEEPTVPSQKQEGAVPHEASQRTSGPIIPLEGGVGLFSFGEAAELGHKDSSKYRSLYQSQQASSAYQTDLNMNSQHVANNPSQKISDFRHSQRTNSTSIAKMSQVIDKCGRKPELLKALPLVINHKSSCFSSQVVTKRNESQSKYTSGTSKVSSQRSKQLSRAGRSSRGKASMGQLMESNRSLIEEIRANHKQALR